MAELKPIIEQSMIQYAGAVIQSRALVDARDGLKPSARQIFYSMLQHKLIHKNPYKKTANAVGMAMADFYIHGDSSCEGIIMRAGQGFAMRYPLVEVKGNAGSLIESGNWAAMRYTESKLSSLSDVLFADIDKGTISEWRDNYDNTKQYPAVLPSKGYYNICNGTSGIATGMASSVPQYNIKELNNALIHLIDNPDCSFEEIYCAPDFATGAILYNEDEVKEAMKNGTGAACKLRSVVDFDASERCFVVTEIPYSVYTNTICGQLESIINGEDNPGIERFNDLTGSKPLLKIYLSKKANPGRVLQFLFKNTSLQSYFGINFTMLDKGRFPKVFTWKEMLQAHIDHEKVVYRRGFENDLLKIEHRIHIIDGLLICLASIDEVVKTIKNSTSSASAAVALQSKFLLDEIQAKAVLDMKLSRLAHLEVQKLENERTDLQAKADSIKNILNDEVLFNNELKNGWRATAAKFGDERRTKIIDIKTDENGEDIEPIEKKSLITYLTNNGNIYVAEALSFVTQRRGGRGTTIKLPKNEFIIDSIEGVNSHNILLFTTAGKVYTTMLDNFTVNTLTDPRIMFNMQEDERVVNIVPYDKKSSNSYMIFTTKNGMVKKTLLSEYNIKRGKGVVAIKLKDNDELVNISFVKNGPLTILTKYGNCVTIDTEKINSTGRATSGVQGIKLNANDYVVDAHIITLNTKEIYSVSAAGMAKRTSIGEFSLCNRATKGNLMQKLRENDSMVSFTCVTDDTKAFIIISNRGAIQIPVSDTQLSSRNTIGTSAKKLINGEHINTVLVKN